MFVLIFLCYNIVMMLYSGLFHRHTNKMYILVRRIFIVMFSIAAMLGLAGDGHAQTDAFAQHTAFNDPGARVSGGGVSGEGLVPVEASIDGGSIPIGGSAQVVILFRNEGAKPVQTGLIRLYPSSNVSAAISMNQCETEQLPSGAECALAMSVKALQQGSWRVEMLMSHSGRSRLVTTTVAGQVAVSEDGKNSLTTDIEAKPDKMDFGSMTSSQTMVESIVLRNVTSNPITINDVYIDSSKRAGYALKTECASLEAGQACIVVVSWSPQLLGKSSGVLVVEHTGPSGLTSIPLSGEYNPSTASKAEIFPAAVPGKGLLVSSQEDLDFGSEVSTASAITVSLVNTGDASLTIKDIEFSGSDSGLGFKEGGCAADTVLEPIEACPLTVTWSPTRVGAVSDAVQIKHDGARGVLVLPVTGQATGTVSQDQKAIMLSDRIISSDGSVSQSSGSISTPSSGANSPGMILDQPVSQQRSAPSRNTTYAMPRVSNPATVLDGYKITSFSASRAIINGPGGSRIVFDGEEIVLGGVPWFVMIQANGIEFLHQGQRVLLLFDRSLSSINRVSAAGDSSSSAGSSGESGG